MGTTQNSRAIPALCADGLAVDARTPRQLLAQTLPTAALFNYYDENATRCGQWNFFYQDVPLVRYAVIAELDLAREEAIFRATLQKLGRAIDAREEGQRAAAWNLLDRLLLVYRNINRDAELFNALPTEAGYAATLRQAITGVLAPCYQTVLAWYDWLAAQYARPEGLAPRFSHDADPQTVPGMRGEWWGAAADLPFASWPHPEAEFVRQLTQATWTTKATLAQLVATAQACFESAYREPRELPPHFALYLAFLRQFAGAQAALNQLPARHVDFFYRDVLRLAPAGPVPDTTFVAFEAAPGGWAELPAGTPLVAGKDADGLPLVYSTLYPTTVSSSALAQIATVYLADGCQPGATGFYAAPVAASADGAGAPLPPGGAWATFGEAQPTGPGRTMSDAQIGFALTSPVLHLEEGARTITLLFTFGPSSATTVKATPVPRWLVDYSSPLGWAAVKAMQCTVQYDPSATAPVPVSLQAVFTLSPGDAPCVNYDPKILGPGFDSRTPALRVCFLNPLDWLDGIEAGLAASLSQAFATASAQTLTVTVTANGLCDLVMAGPSGKLVPPGKPIAPFGSPAQAAGRLALGKVEVFRKQLTSLTVNFSWQGLPADAQGLSDYYADYNTLLDPVPAPLMGNSVYTVGFAALLNREWVTPTPPPPPPPPAPPPPPPAVDYLFDWTGRTATPFVADGQLAGTSTWTMSAELLAAMNAAPAYGLAGPLDAGPAAVTGFLGITLGSPDYVFGQALYPKLVSTIAMDNALVLIANAKTPAAGGKAPVALNPQSAFAKLKAPAPQSTLGRLWSKLRPGAAPALTFKSRVFASLAKLHGLPAELEADLSAAGHDAAAVFEKLATLKQKVFTDPTSLQLLVAKTLGLDPVGETALVARVIHWLAEQHSTGSAAKTAADEQTELEDIKGMPSAPINPLVSSLTLDYTATATINLVAPPTTTPAPAPAWDRVWQLAPLAVYPRPAGAAPLLAPVTPGGCLYLGFTGVEPPETLSLLFIMAAVPAAAAASDQPAVVPPVWSYLQGDTWRTDHLDASAVHDGTMGFTRTGVVRVELPMNADLQHAVMPAGFIWLRVQVSDPAQHLRTVQVLGHAAVVSWQPPVGGTSAALAAHFAQPLPAGSITGLQVPVPAIAKVVQPLPATGGRRPEDSAAFNTRVSERLRHKARAVAAPDYERLLLQQFPEIFSARALTPAAAQAPAGTVTVVVLPTVATPPVAPPPGFVQGDLLAFAAAVATVAPMSAQVVVTNPRYESIWVYVQVVFRNDRSYAHYQDQLTAELQAFISPWIYDQAAVTDPVQRFHASDFSVFVRNRPYVLEVGICNVLPGQPPLAGVVPDLSGAIDRVAASSPRAMLISAPRHLIVPLS